MATSGLLKKLLPLVPAAELKDLRAEAFANALETWDPEKVKTSYSESWKCWEATQMLGVVSSFLKGQKKRSFKEEAGGDIELVVSPGRSPLRIAFNKEVRAIVASAMGLLSTPHAQLVRAHYWGDKPLAPQQHKALYEVLAALRHTLSARGYKAEDLIWDCGPERSRISQAESLFAA